MPGIIRPAVIGETVGGYVLVAKLGEGGMGTVYAGEHRRIARKAAVKVLLPEFSANQQIVERFFNEARATSLISHPGIVEVLDCDLLPSGSAYIIMELLEGESLGALLRRDGGLSVQRAAAVARDIADALAAAHAKAIVHRDLKPDNVFLARLAGGRAPTTKILDFGIAKLTARGGGPEQQHKTRTGSLLGTPTYMSPEQCRGAGQVDHRTDIYSLGCIMFEMIAGRPPFTSEGFGELIHAHGYEAPPLLSSLVPGVPDAIGAFVGRLLAKSPQDRPATMTAVIAELDAALAGQPVAALDAPASRPIPGGTMFMPQVHTTLQSATAQKIGPGDRPDASDAPAPRRGRTGAIIAVAAAAVVGVGVWRLGARSSSGVVEAPPARPVAMVTPESTSAPPVVAPPPPAPSAPETKHGAPPPTPPEEHLPIARQPPRDTKVHAPHVVITSDPPGADVCAAADRILIGRTKLDWRPAKAGPVKLLVRKHGYRGEEVTLTVERDVKKAVKLERLGPDDLDDVDTCHKQ